MSHEDVTEVEGQKPELNTEELLAQLEQLKSTNERLLKESKEAKSKWKSVMTEAEERKLAELKAKEDYKSLYEQTSQEKSNYQKQLEDLKSQTMYNSIKFQVARMCPDAHDVEDVINKVKISPTMVNPETGEVDGINSQIDEVRKKYAYLFKKDIAPMNNNHPSYKSNNLTFEQELRTAKTQKEFDQIRAKHGRS